MAKIVTLYNFSKDDFTYNWDNEPYTFKAETTTQLPEGLARHFAKHLADRELIKDGFEPGRRDMHQKYVTKALVGESKEDFSESKLEVELAKSKTDTKEVFTCDQCDKEFNTEPGLKSHITKTHTDEEKFEGLEKE